MIMLLIASIFIIGPSDWLGDAGKKMYHSYFADFAIPFGYYFLLILMEDQLELLQNWYVKASAVFILCTTSEILQYFGIYALASVFDPVDILVYALGAGAAALADRKIFTRVFGFWK
ncbi:hypothetical protein DFQ04_2967 [Algoriphagus boseongensis]|uniref:VanZ like protein n=1 Tax=Algoriphagus boseongensis TaxID=1442587 RepID=A0A4R6T3K1_9BACT|nr:hypothetical protein DFQ04_2967 [Algoriphagus boseongensis]